MWHRVCKESDLTPASPVLYPGKDGVAALFKAGSKCYAIDNVCPHRGGPLVEGQVENGAVICPWHAWTFNLKNGECDGIPGVKQKCYEVKVEQGEVWVKI